MSGAKAKSSKLVLSGNPSQCRNLWPEDPVEIVGTDDDVDPLTDPIFSSHYVVHIVIPESWKTGDCE